MTFRTAQLDPDNRRDPKTNFACIRCARDLRPGQPHRWVRVVGGGAQVLHPEDEAIFHADEEAMRGDLGGWPIGMDCARKVGLAFTVEPSVYGYQSPALPDQAIGAE